MKNLFNRSKRLAKVTKNTALLAIAAHDVKGIRMALQLAPEEGLSKEDNGELAAAAIEAKDLETYQAVCELTGGPNTAINFSAGFNKHFCLNACDQLHYALYTPGAEQIARFIAAHPDYRAYDGIISETRVLKTEEVTSLLARKLLPSHREALAQLEAEAARVPAETAPPARKSGLNL
jgi:hypothetical protein